MMFGGLRSKMPLAVSNAKSNIAVTMEIRCTVRNSATTVLGTDI